MRIGNKLKTSVIVLLGLALAGPSSAAGAKTAQHAAAAKPNATVLEAEVMLARIGFSPGVIDAQDGNNFANALHAFLQGNGLAPGRLDGTTWAKLTQLSGGAVLGAYTIQPGDVAGPCRARGAPDNTSFLQPRVYLVG